MDELPLETSWSSVDSDRSGEKDGDCWLLPEVSWFSSDPDQHHDGEDCQLVVSGAHSFSSDSAVDRISRRWT